MLSDDRMTESRQREPESGRSILSMGACVSRNCKRTSWKMGALGAEREPEAMEPFSSAASDSPQRCKMKEQTVRLGFNYFFTCPCAILELLTVLPPSPRFLLLLPSPDSHFLYHLPIAPWSLLLTLNSYISTFPLCPQLSLYIFYHFFTLTISTLVPLPAQSGFDPNCHCPMGCP